MVQYFLPMFDLFQFNKIELQKSLTSNTFFPAEEGTEKYKISQKQQKLINIYDL
jgi:hypothetical protein